MQISSLDSKVIISDDLHKEIYHVLKVYEGERLFVLVDENTRRHCWPLMSEIEPLKKAEIIEINSGEAYKNIETTIKIWSSLSDNMANRKSVLINLGGGVICDMGGFAASTFKRGIRFVHIPTTLLAQVDASVGGKLGIDFKTLKNEIGIFNTPEYVVIDPVFLKTLDRDNLLSGYAEMIKHALIYSTEHWDKVKEVNFDELNYKLLKNNISKSIFIKNDFVKADFKEANLRKALNFGHTAGHAIESLWFERKPALLHGQAIAHGIIIELYLSHKLFAFSKAKLEEVSNFIMRLYGKLDILTEDENRIYDYITHDKKNQNKSLNFTLLESIGQVEINVHCDKSLIIEALDYYRDFTPSA